MKNFFFFTGGIRINKIRILILATLILTLSSCVGAATEYTVNSGDSIQAVVTNAKSGDVITIGPGTYTENLAINSKTNLLIRSSAGPANTTIANNTGTNVITLQSCTNVTIQGLTVTGAGTDNAGIYVDRSNNCKVEGNIMHDDALGIYLWQSQNTIIRNNIATKDNLPGKGRAINIELSSGITVSNNTVSNQRYGIYISGSSTGILSGNTVDLCADDGIRLEESSTGITVENNNLNSNGQYGIYLSKSSGNFLRNNDVFNSTNNSIEVSLSSGNEISDNTISDSSIATLTHAIHLNTAHNNVLRNNAVSNNDYGIAMIYSNNNSVVNNTASNNNRGIYVAYTSSLNTISNNQVHSNIIGGIVLQNCNNNNVFNNEVTLNTGSSTTNGITLGNAINNNVANNDASGNRRGIFITSSSSANTISGNTVNSNTGDGIRLEGAGINNNITSNTVSSNNYGIYLVRSNNSYVLNNTAPGNSKGIYLDTSSGSTIFNNTASDNSADGIMLSLSSNNNVSGNTAYNNDQFGISLNSSRSNNISSNHIALSGSAGMYLCPQSTKNLIFNNYLNNVVNANNNNNGSIWNVTKTSGKNIIGGPHIGGNYWVDPVLKNDHSQTAPDVNPKDGIADTIYNGDKLVDYLPLVYTVFPDADFTSNVSSGNAPLSVKFTDKSKYATKWAWDFDNDGKSDSDLQNPVHVFTVPGSYNVKLTASNQNGTDSQTAIITVTENIPPVNIQPVANFSPSTTSGYAPLLVTFTDLSQNATKWDWDFGDGATSTLPSPTHTYSASGDYTVKLTVSNGNNFASKTATINVYSSGGGRGGGGGGGGSPEPARNVEVKELSQTFITNGKAVKFDFTKNATCVVYVGFDAKKTVGKTTTIAEQLKNKSTLVSSLSEGEVYKYFNVWVGNSGFATSTNIDNPTICFKVEKSWVQDKKIDKDSITLNRYSDKKWEQLPTSLLNEDSKYLYFTADVPGYSFFAITGKTNATPEKTETEIQPDDSDSEEMENTSSESNQESGEKENTGVPGFEIVYGVAGLLAVFLYKRK